MQVHIVYINKGMKLMYLKKRNFIENIIYINIPLISSLTATICVITPRVMFGYIELKIRN